MASTMVFRKTNAHTGRLVSVTPANSPNRHLSYGRIILNRTVDSVSFRNPGQETGLIVLSGSATLIADGQRADLNQFDGAYIPRDAGIQLSSATSADIAEFSADVSERQPFQVVRYTD